VIPFISLYKYIYVHIGFQHFSKLIYIEGFLYARHNPHSLICLDSLKSHLNSMTNCEGKASVKKEEIAEHGAACL
jgi:hypothetical protein